MCLQLYNLALALRPGQPGTFAALGYTHQIIGHLPEAIEVRGNHLREMYLQHFQFLPLFPIAPVHCVCLISS